MQPFSFAVARSRAEAIALAAEPGTALVAGGTEIVNWMKDGIAAARRLVHLRDIPDLTAIEAGADGVRIGALARLADVADHPAVRQEFPAVAEALMASASAQIRTMATVGGNLLQRTRCPYFRAEAELPCNKRRPGSGCAMREGVDRQAAIFGASAHCVATHPSDLAVALAALDAVVHVEGPQGARAIPIGDFHRLPGHTPEVETALAPGELVTAVVVPASALARRSRYLKVRERASYEFALVAAAAAADLEGGTIRAARIALGGVAPKPWRLPAVEAALAGLRVDDAAALRRAIDTGFADARPGRNNGFRIELAARAALRALQAAGGGQ